MASDELFNHDLIRSSKGTASPQIAKKSHLSKKESISKNRFFEVDESVTKDRMERSTRNRKDSYSSDKEDTIIEMGRSPTPDRRSTSRKLRMTHSKRGNSLETDETSDSDNETVRKTRGDKNANLSETMDDDLHEVSNKTTSALLLAEENSQILGSPMLRDGNIWNVLSFREPRKWKDEEWKKWSKITYYPSNNPVPESEKLSDDVEARKPNEEGLFVGDPIKLTGKNWNLLECRLMTENSLEWFGSDGKLSCFPDPYRPDPVQLLQDDDRQTDVDKNLIFKPAKLDPFQEFKIDPNQGYEIELDLGYITFSHHPYFSKEHVIATNLEVAFEEYSQRRLNGATERAVNKLKALREAVAHTKEAISRLDHEIENESNLEKCSDLKEHLQQHKKRLTSYRNEIQKCALSRDRGYWDDKASISAVLEAWKVLKNLREHQGYTNTSLKLNIMELPGDTSKEKEMWMKEIEEDMQDIQDENEELYEIDMAKYRAKIKSWNEKKQRKKSRDQSDDSDALVTRPKPPLKPDTGEFRKKLEKRYKEIKRRPGEPNIVFDLVRTATVTQVNQLPDGSTKEHQRRKAVKKCKIELHLWFNGKEIYVSKPRDISSDFNVFLGFKVPISIAEWPELLEIQVVELGTKMKTFMVPIQLPNRRTTVERCHMQKVKFISEDVIKTSHDGVGSGIAFEILGKDYEDLYPIGYITHRCGWTTDKDGNVMCPRGFEGQGSVDTDLQYEVGTGRKLLDNSQLDPNDPRNAHLQLGMEKLKQPMQTLASPRKYSGDDDLKDKGFTLDKFMDEFEFCSMETIEKSLRFQVLQLRDNGVPEFKNIRMVPPSDKNVTGEAFLAYERRLKEDLRKRMGDTSFAKIGRKKLIEDDIVYESNRLEKIKEMRLSVLQLFEKSLKQITFEDLVVEEQIPDIGTLGLNLMSFFQPRRPLRPIRKERKRIQASNLVDTKIGLIANIVRAFNLPLRKDTDVGLLTTESVTGIQVAKKRPERITGNYSTVKPFVEIWFQRNVARTTTGLGSNPTWNQELHLELMVPNDDYSQANLSKMDDLVYLLLYDEVAIDMLEDERRRETDIYQRIEKRWLGSITIPFSTLYTNGRIEGTFKLNSPPILLGYEAQGMANHFGGLNLAPRGSGSSSNNPSSTADLKAVTGIPFNNQKNTFMTIFLTLQPAVQPSAASNSKEDGASGESADIMSYVKNWKNAFEKKFPERFVKPFVMTAEGDTILCTRYLKPIEPPEIFLNSDGEILYVMEDLAHYVSLFPSIRDSTLGITDYSLWFTSDVFVMTPGGGIEDHAVLLACFFMHLNIPCWIVQGNAIPDGPTTFVITSFKGMGEDKGISKPLKNAVLVWNPCTGEYYSANDNFCPLQKVCAAVSKKNIWANVSEGERTHQIDWDIGKSKSWQPLFVKPVSEDKIPSVQMGLVKYKSPDQVQANSLAQRIERHLKEVFMKWRKTSKTNWNRYCSATLRRLLPRLEETKSGRSKAHEVPGSGSIESTMSVHSGSLVSVNDEHLMELREVMTSYQMTGFPLQQPYVNMESITEVVFATGVHTIDTPDVEFALAAYAHAYPASVYSVWIYVAALHRRK